LNPINAAPPAHLEKQLEETGKNIWKEGYLRIWTPVESPSGMRKQEKANMQ
jgi:hypothetical protein